MSNSQVFFVKKSFIIEVTHSTKIVRDVWCCNFRRLGDIHSTEGQFADGDLGFRDRENQDGIGKFVRKKVNFSVTTDDTWNRNNRVVINGMDHTSGFCKKNSVHFSEMVCIMIASRSSMIDFSVGVF